VYNSTYDHSTTINAGTATNANVYVYPDDGTGNYSYAIHNTVSGVTIWNGP
jgi:phosphotransacetylase